jgi:hypothetical protein
MLSDNEAINLFLFPPSLPSFFKHARGALFKQQRNGD